MFEALLEEPLIELEMKCQFRDAGSNTRKTSSFTPLVVQCQISFVIYGPSHLFEDVGDFFQGYDMYLQDPFDCDRDVKYYNPHRLSSKDLLLCPLTSALRDMTNSALEVEELPSQPESLDLLDSHQDLPEAAQPAAIQTSLKRYSRPQAITNEYIAKQSTSHQKQALTFMLQREKGWTFEPGKSDLWDIRYSRGKYW